MSGEWGQYFWRGTIGLWFLFSKMGLEGVLHLSVYHTADPVRESLFQCAGKEAPNNYQTNDSEEIILIMSC